MRPESESNPFPALPTLHSTNGLATANGDGSSSENGATSTSAAVATVVIDGDEIKPLSRVPTATAEAPEWQATIERVVKNVVAIHFCQTCSFDTDPALSSEATGFVVDAERGYIMTNRHVVGAGPFWGHCIFDNHEEVSCF
jgi:pro-apoptotic serine protease NMA111